MSGVGDSPWADRLRRTRRNNPWAEFESHEQKEWPVLDTAALYGLPGEVVRAIAPHTEAAQVALLAQYPERLEADIRSNLGADPELPRL